MTFLKNILCAGSIVLLSLSACTNSTPTQLNLSGSIDGITSGKAIISIYDAGKRVEDSIKIEEGKFNYTTTLKEPKQITIIVGDRGYLFFYAENGNMTVKGHVDSLHKAVITGSATQDDAKKLDIKREAIAKKLNINALYEELYKGTQSKEITKEREAEINTIVEGFAKECEQLQNDFIKENPKSYYSAVLAAQLASGKDAAGIEEYIALLDPSLVNTEIIKELRSSLEEAKKTGVTYKDYIPNAHNLTYEVDKAYAGSKVTDVIYLAVLSNDNLCCMTKDGNVVIVSPKGEKVAEFKSGLKSKAAVIATDKKDNIYVIGSVSEIQEKVSRGKTYKMENAVGIECLVLDVKGKFVREIKLADVVTATGVRVSENNIIVADTRGRKIVVFDLETGAKKSTVENLRTCCGILDFATRNNSEILVANLGNFRVDGFDFNGKPIVSFGQRGTGLNDFHGCCNPVSVEFLSNGGVVTVEKDPTRIKVYSNEGAKQIAGIEELVKGCAYIPVIIDSKDNIYLASKESGLVKCIMSK